MRSRLAIGLFILGFSCAANAGLMTLTAATTDSTTLSSFSLTFNDSGNGLFDFGELVSFSGVTVICNGNTFFYDTLIKVPAIAGISTAGGACSGAADIWCFSAPMDIFGTSVTYWTYSEAETPTNVPEPSTALLIGAGLIGLALPRKRGQLRGGTVALD